MNIDKENSHWTKERWEKEKENVKRCLVETEIFVNETKEIGKQKVKLSTMDDFKEMLDKKKKLDKLGPKTEYLTFLKARLEEIDLKIIQGGK